MLNINKILRSTDAQDPFNEAAGGVDTTFPVLEPDRIVEFKIDSCKKGPSKNNPASEVLTVKFKTTKETTLQGGKKQAPGFPVFKRIGLTPTEPSVGEDGTEKAGRSTEQIKKDLAGLMKAAYGPKTDITLRMLLDNPAMLEGEIVQGRTSVDKGSGSFGPSTNFSYVLPA